MRDRGRDRSAPRPVERAYAESEILLPPRSRGRQVRGPELEARVREALERTARDMVRQGKLDTVPDR